MKKISTLYKKDLNDLSRVINEIAPENKWVIDGEGLPTRKFHGTASAIIDGELYKRYDSKLKTGKVLKKMNYYIDLLQIGTVVTKVSLKKFSNNSLFDEIVGFGVHPITKEKSADRCV